MHIREALLRLMLQPVDPCHVCVLPFPAAGKSGLIVNTCGWIEGQGYDLILHAAQTFQVDVVLVCDTIM